MLDANLTQQLKAYLVHVRFPVELVASLGQDAKSHQMRELLDEIAALSDKVGVTTGDDDRTPSFLIRRAGCRDDAVERYATGEQIVRVVIDAVALSLRDQPKIER